MCVAEAAAPVATNRRWIDARRIIKYIYSFLIRSKTSLCERKSRKEVSVRHLLARDLLVAAFVKRFPRLCVLGFRACGRLRPQCATWQEEPSKAGSGGALAINSADCRRTGAAAAAAAAETAAAVAAVAAVTSGGPLWLRGCVGGGAGEAPGVGRRARANPPHSALPTRTCAVWPGPSVNVFPCRSYAPLRRSVAGCSPSLADYSRPAAAASAAVTRSAAVASGARRAARGGGGQGGPGAASGRLCSGSALTTARAYQALDRSGGGAAAAAIAAAATVTSGGLRWLRGCVGGVAGEGSGCRTPRCNDPTALGTPHLYLRRLARAGRLRFPPSSCAPLRRSVAA